MIIKKRKNENDFKDCGLDSVPNTVYALQNLETLYLENNKLLELPDNFFGHFTHLKWLDLRKNKLKSLPATIQDHPALETLLLDDNELSVLPTELGSVLKLKGLQVTNNPLKYPPESVVKKGVQHLIHFLREEWRSRNRKDTSQVYSGHNPSGIFAVQNSTQVTRHKGIIHLQLKEKRGAVKKSSEKNKLKKVKTPLLTVERYFRVKKLLKAKPETTLNLFEFWDQLTPSLVMERFKYAHLAQYEIKDSESQKSFRPSSTTRNLHTGTFQIPQRVKYQLKWRSVSRRPVGGKLKSKEDFEKDVQTRHLESLKRLQRRLSLERQDRILQRGKNKEALKIWRTTNARRRPRRHSKSQIRRILHDPDEGYGGQTNCPRESAEDVLKRFDSIRKEFQELALGGRQHGGVSLEMQQRLAEERMQKIHGIQKDLKELRRSLQ